jgi:hypothetical protein
MLKVVRLDRTNTHILCISDNRGFSIYDLEEAISEDLKIELKVLQVRLCEKYIGFLNSEDYFVYCSKK